MSALNEDCKHIHGFCNDSDDDASFFRSNHELSMEPLVEVHASIELDVALEAGAKVIGVNNLKMMMTIVVMMKIHPLKR